MATAPAWVVLLLISLLLGGGLAGLLGSGPDGARLPGPPSSSIPTPAAISFSDRAAASSSAPRAAAFGPFAAPPANSSPYPETGTPIASARPVPSAYGIALDPKDGYLYVADRGSNNVTVLNGTRLVATIRVGLQPTGVTFDPQNGFVYVTNYASNNVTLLTGTSVAGWIDDPSFAGPGWAAYDPLDHDLYVPNANNGGVSILNGSALVGFLATGTGAWAAAFDPVNGFVYVTNGAPSTSGGSSVSVIDNASVVANLTGNFTEPSGLAFDPQDGRMYVANRNVSSLGGGFVTVVGGLNVVARVPVGPELWGMTYDPLNQCVYASGNDVDETSNSAHANSIAAIRDSTLLGYVPVGTGPYGSTFVPSTGLLYVANGASNNVTVVSTELALGPATATPLGDPAYTMDIGGVLTVSAPLLAIGSGLGVPGALATPAGPLDCGPPSMSSRVLSVGPITFACSARAAGNVTIWLNVTDTTGAIVWSRVPIQVFALPTTGAPIPDRFTMDVGQNLSFTAQITAPGSGGDRYSWTASGGLTCSPSSTLSLRCLATSPGSGALVQLNVTDSNGGNTSVTSPALAVAPDPNVSAPVIAPDPVRVGHSVTMTVLVTGGTGAFRPTWVGLPPGCTGAALAVTCQPSQTGEFRISATVNDSAGFVASSAAAYLNVTAPPVSTNILGVDPLVFYGVLIAIVVVAFSGALGVRMRRRRPPPAPSPSPPR